MTKKTKIHTNLKLNKTQWLALKVILEQWDEEEDASFLFYHAQQILEMMGVSDRLAFGEYKKYKEYKEYKEWDKNFANCDQCGRPYLKTDLIDVRATIMPHGEEDLCPECFKEYTENA